MTKLKLKIHQTKHILADFPTILNYLTDCLNLGDINTIHIFPELYLTGYPLKDLCLQKSFITSYLHLIEQINQYSINISDIHKNSNQALLIGGLYYTFDDEKIPLSIENVVFELIPGKKLKKLYTKILLPNYDIFDEKKYFKNGTESCVYQFNDQNIGIMICEDMWHTNVYKIDPIKILLDRKVKLDAIVNLSASPYFLGKPEKRIIRAKEISNIFNCPFFYVNRVGAEDEIIFDGQSFAVIDNKTTYLKMFESDIKEFDLSKSLINSLDSSNEKIFKTENTWEALFAPNLDNQSPPQINTLSDQQCETLLNSIIFGLQEYTQKNNFKNFLVALSGGLDSAIVLAIAKIAIKKSASNQIVEAIFMPGKYTETLSYDLSYEMCELVKIKLYNLPIKFMHSAIENAFLDGTKMPLDGLSGENIQSRIRGSLLYALANKTGSMVINTSNKSELSVGYSTLYGDSVGAISILGDLYKSEIYQLAKFINKSYGQLIPENIIIRDPSAELRDNQKDSDSLPRYIILDSILEAYLSCRYDIDDIIKMGFSEDDVYKTIRLYKNSEFKRSQFCPILKLKNKSFGFGYRIPINYKLYNKSREI